MAHNEIELLKVLLSLLDYERNDIYLHIDAKAEGFEISELMECVKKSKLFIVEPRIDVKWGNFSQIECEYRLLERATPQKYMYYHMMSGVDLPLKTQGEIHQFFDENYGTEYIQFESSELTNEEKNRVSKYHFIAKRKKNIIEKMPKEWRLCHIDANCDNFLFYKENEEEKIKYQKWEKIINVMAVVGLLILGIFITVPCCLDIPYLLSNNLVEVTGEVTQGAMSGENSNSERRIHIRDEKTGEEHSLKYWGTGSDLGDKITVRYLPHTEYGYVVE